VLLRDQLDRRLDHLGRQGLEPQGVLERAAHARVVVVGEATPRAAVLARHHRAQEPVDADAPAHHVGRRTAASTLLMVGRWRAGAVALEHRQRLDLDRLELDRLLKS
jgi:hypothetical protein